MRIILFGICFISTFTYSQRNLADSSLNTFVTALNYKFNLTSGDISDMWGVNHEIGFSVDNKFKNGLTIGLNSGFIFGDQFKDSTVFSGLYNEFGTITGLNGAPAEVLYLMRGFTININGGYIFNKLGNNPNSGLWLQGGAGMLMHKIRIESLYDDVPQLEGDYRLGYDKMHMGFSTRQFVGYLYQGDKKFLNFYAGFEFIQGFTVNQRSFNFDTGGPDLRRKTDFLWGIKAGWLIPIYKREPKEFYTN